MPTPDSVVDPAQQHEKAERFRRLHQRDGAFVFPNPWDAGSARMMQSLGFEALATTSAGFAWTLGRLDGEVTLDEKLEHCRALCAATEVPVAADLENGFADDPEGVAATIRRASATGLVGGSIEDWSGTAIYDFEHAVERVQAAVEAARELPFRFVLTARAENLLHGVQDLDDTIRRLQAFERAGADVLYAPALRTLDEVRQVTASVSAPVNVLGVMVVGTGDRGVTVDDLATAGAKRISIGGALARAAFGGLLGACTDLQDGRFDWLADAAPGDVIARRLGG